MPDVVLLQSNPMCSTNPAVRAHTKDEIQTKARWFRNDIYNIVHWICIHNFQKCIKKVCRQRKIAPPPLDVNKLEIINTVEIVV